MLVTNDTSAYCTECDVIYYNITYIFIQTQFSKLEMFLKL